MRDERSDVTSLSDIVQVQVDFTKPTSQLYELKRGVRDQQALNKDLQDQVNKMRL